MLNIDIKVGCKGLKESQWGELFFPDDLPIDWKFDYYCNEFSTLLLDTSDIMDIHSLLEDGLTDEFKLVLITDKEVCSDLEVDNIDSVKQFKPIENFLILQKAYSQYSHPVYYYHDETLLSPVQLKKLLDFCLADSGVKENCISEDNHMIYLFFSDKIHAIENTRNMNILIQML
jgi:hypothetical protein